MSKKNENSSWESVSGWYDQIVGNKGHYYHEHVILPKMKSIISEHCIGCKKILDFACGQGILSKTIPKDWHYLGIDVSSSLIDSAKRTNKNRLHQFQVSDLTRPLTVDQNQFDLCTIVLALQNISDPLAVMKNAWNHLKKEGHFLLILNHPCFRIPRQTSWEIDEEKKIQYRRIDRYMSFLKIPILAHPSQKEQSTQTLSFHRNLSDYTKMLNQSGFVIEFLDEWCSDKKSTGSKARMENRSREEIPMFLAILAKKL